MERICVFCGSNSGAQPIFTEMAAALGAEMVHRGYGLVYGGGKVGLMGTLADAVLAAGGEVVGVIPQALVDRELAHRGLTDLRIVHSMHERKAMMAELAGAFIAMPGGYGTLEEFCEILTWAQLGLHRKACGLLNVAGFYDPFLAQIDLGVAEKFIRQQHRELFVVETQPEALLQKLSHFKLPAIHKWIDRDET